MLSNWLSAGIHDFSLRQGVHLDSETYSASYQIVTEDSFLWDKTAGA
jgi:hypothetical protein